MSNYRIILYKIVCVWYNHEEKNAFLYKMRSLYYTILQYSWFLKKKTLNKIIIFIFTQKFYILINLRIFYELCLIFTFVREWRLWLSQPLEKRTHRTRLVRRLHPSSILRHVHLSWCRHYQRRMVRSLWEIGQI